MAEAVEAVYALALYLGIRNDLTDNCSGLVRSVRNCAAKTAGQSHTKYSTSPQGRGFESWLCHTELTSRKNGVGKH